MRAPSATPIVPRASAARRLAPQSARGTRLGAGSRRALAAARRLACLLAGLAALAAFAPRASAEPFARKLKKDMQAGWVITVSDIGDLILFGGAVTIPSHRPSAEFCGEWLTTDREARATKTAAKMSEAQRAGARFTAGERLALRHKVTEPNRRCEGNFNRHCKSTLARISRSTRKLAVAEAKAAIGRLPEQNLAPAIRGYLAHVLRQCPLER